MSVLPLRCSFAGRGQMALRSRTIMQGQTVAPPGLCWTLSSLLTDPWPGKRWTHWLWSKFTMAASNQAGYFLTATFLATLGKCRFRHDTITLQPLRSLLDFSWVSNGKMRSWCQWWKARLRESIEVPSSSSSSPPPIPPCKRDFCAVFACVSRPRALNQNDFSSLKLLFEVKKDTVHESAGFVLLVSDGES